MNDIFNTIENVSTLSLCYLDEIDESLKEIDESIYFAVSAKNITYKRLYLIGDLIYKGIFKVSAFLPDDFENDYTVKLRLGEQYTTVNDFIDSTNTVSGNYNDLGYKYGNAIPLDVLIQSNELTESSTSVNFILEWDSYENNCINPNFIRSEQTVEDDLLTGPTVVTVKVLNQVIRTINYETDVYVYDVIHDSKANNLLNLMDLTFNENNITCSWQYNTCISISDDKSRLNIELRGTEDMPA